jgi:hypothetical protein
VATDFDSKTELDFRNRMIAKFSIPSTKPFWGSGFEQIPESALYPKSDRILDLCANLQAELQQELQPGDLGEFIKEWALLEDYLLDEARRKTQRNVSIREAITALTKSGKLDSQQAALLDSLRRFRNGLVHQPAKVHPGALEEWLMTMRQMRRQLQPNV